MDLGFTADPDWIARRTEQWLPVEENLSDSFTKREIAQWKTYFFTGQLPDGAKISPTEILQCFPIFNKESVEYCCKKLISPRLNQHEYDYIQYMFFGGLRYVPDLSFDEKLKWFYAIYGDCYKPNRVFPFLIGNETTFRPITIRPLEMFDITFGIRDWLDGKCEQSIWNVYREYFFSLLPCVDEAIFSKPIGRAYLKGRVGTAQAKIIALIKYCFYYQDPDPTSPQSAARHDYLAFFRDRMDNLDHYPGELKALWESMKAEYS